MHLDGHKLLCRKLFSLNYLKGAGRIHGEGIEQSWAESKQSGGSTRQMNHGHRHNIIIDLHNFWNWLKTESMVSYLFEKYLESLDLREKAMEHYCGLSRSRGKEMVVEWMKLDENPKKVGKNGSAFTISPPRDVSI
ncbi:hypothetical protein PM082_024892 [Marasmius tenuissimus]|nr:hypothetical protein PM082_024892 [Marasmius tenuissimus]